MAGGLLGRRRALTIEGQLDALGQPSTDVRTGEAVTFRIHYSAEESIPDPTFAVAVHTLEGVLVTSPTTREAGLTCDRIDGRGVVDLAVDPLLLLPGTYDLSASVSDAAALHVYDTRHRAVRFDVEPGRPHETHGGVVSLAGRWHLRSSEG